ncbi:MAG: type II toxin-antitoxin system RelE/ParE family toxin [Ottowia sp.]|nr:type II toxin-antitoxin system RelE/ParE family toxin [Ottowia sp.]
MQTYVLDWAPDALDAVYAFGDYVAQQSSPREGESVVARIFKAAEPLRHSPLAYSPAPEWGEGVRRLPTLGRRILFEVDEAARVVSILAVVGGAENPREVR